MKHSKTDCRDYDGITVGLITSIITTSRILRERMAFYHKQYSKRYQKDIKPNFVFTECVLVALDDLHNDEDLLIILQSGNFNPNIISKDQQKMMQTLSNSHEFITNLKQDENYKP